jgi:hypothetical protein
VHGRYVPDQLRRRLGQLGILHQDLWHWQQDAHVRAVHGSRQRRHVLYNHLRL